MKILCILIKLRSVKYMGMLTLQELEATLWKAADILRGELNAAEYKGLHIRYVVFKADE